METIVVEFYPETNDAIEVVHNHFDCPSCHTKNAPTSIYCGIFELESDEFDFECEHCDAKFSFVTGKELNGDLEYEIIERQS